eukprot:419387-Amphidinium_carterae.1
MVRKYLVTRSDICTTSDNSTATNSCVDAVLDRLAHLLLSSLIHATFTLPSVQLTLGRNINFSAAWVLVAFVWVLTLLLGACIPLLMFPLVMIILVHKFLLFGQEMLH